MDNEKDETSGANATYIYIKTMYIYIVYVW